jgi:hypothetical protein
MTFNIGDQVISSPLGLGCFGTPSFQLGNNIGVISDVSSSRTLVITVDWTDNEGKEMSNYYYPEHLQKYVPLELEEML